MSELGWGRPRIAHGALGCSRQALPPSCPQMLGRQDHRVELRRAGGAGVSGGGRGGGRQGLGHQQYRVPLQPREEKGSFKRFRPLLLLLSRVLRNAPPLSPLA